mgnify:CR=1 FL=1
MINELLVIYLIVDIKSLLKIVEGLNVHVRIVYFLYFTSFDLKKKNIIFDGY